MLALVHRQRPSKPANFPDPCPPLLLHPLLSDPSPLLPLLLLCNRFLIGHIQNHVLGKCADREAAIKARDLVACPFTYIHWVPRHMLADHVCKCKLSYQEPFRMLALVSCLAAAAVTLFPAPFLSSHTACQPFSAITVVFVVPRCCTFPGKDVHAACHCCSIQRHDCTG